MNGHFSIQSIHLCLDITRLFNLHSLCYGPQQQCYKEVVVYYNFLSWIGVYMQLKKKAEQNPLYNIPQSVCPTSEHAVMIMMIWS